MNFRVWAALGVGVLVVAPLVAHLLRRRPPDEQPFAPTRLVPESKAIASRRTAIEDRALFALRALAVLALAVLGATPLFRCSKLQLARKAGASVALAIVIDDSLSMRAKLAGSDTSRLARAVEGAKQLTSGLQQGDAVAVVLSGKPARVALAATTNLDAARVALDTIAASDRASDLDDAVRVAGDLVSSLEHVDKRIVVLGDLEDEPNARVEAPPGVALWAPLTELRGSVDDCGVVRADRAGTRVSVRVACTRLGAEASKRHAGTQPDASASAGLRRVAIVAGNETLADVRLTLDDTVGEHAFTLPDAMLEKHRATQLYATLLGGDAIAEDDAAPVVSQGAELHAAVVSDPANDRVPTGGAPLVEQAFRALEVAVQLTPLAGVPDRREELEPLGLLLVDDAEGFTPAERRDLEAWVERGGVLFLALGPHAAAAPLGSGFSPLLPALVRFRPSPVKGLALRDDALFSDAQDGLDDLAPKGRALLEVEANDARLATLARWSDGAPFVVERRIGRGVVLAMTLPLGSQESDFGLRPALFSLLDRVVAEARSRSGTGRTLVGATWSLEGRTATVRRVGRDDKAEAVPVEAVGEAREVSPARAGLYELATDGTTATRVAAIDEREFTAAPVELPSQVDGTALGGTSSEVDVSPQVALFLLALLAAELLLRAVGPRLRRSSDSGELARGALGPR